MALLAARADHVAGRLADAELRAAEDKAISAFVALQEKLGFQVVTDGEFRRSTYTSNFTTEGLTGITAEHKTGNAWSYTNAAGHKEPARIPAVHARIRWNNSRNAQDFAALARMTRVLPKITLPGPCYIHFRAGRAGISRDVYPDLDAFWSDLVEAYVQEMRSLADAGCRYLQIDETSLVKLGDPRVRQLLA